MRSLIPSLVLFAGACLSCVGLWWVWTGLDIVQVERGWTAVIAGATMLSAGLVMAALAAVLVRLGDIADVLAEGAAVPTPVAGNRSLDAAGSDTETTGDTLQAQVVREDETGRQIVGRHASGDATYIMFADGSVEAQTPEGTVSFASLDALRAYADEREAADGRAVVAERS